MFDEDHDHDHEFDQSFLAELRADLNLFFTAPRVGRVAGQCASLLYAAWVAGLGGHVLARPGLPATGLACALVAVSALLPVFVEVLQSGRPTICGAFIGPPLVVVAVAAAAPLLADGRPVLDLVLTLMGTALSLGLAVALLIVYRRVELQPIERDRGLAS